MPVHARLSPSKGDLWVRCSGGIPFIEANADRITNRDVVSPTGVAAIGTKSHAYGEAIINSVIHPDESAREHHRDSARRIAEDLPGEFITNAEQYAAWATEFVMTRPDIPWGLELAADLWYEPGSQGYADFWAVDKTELIVVDYKSGRLPVPVEENIQVGIYLVGIYDMLKKFHPQIKTFKAGIMQPFTAPRGRREPVWWTLDLETLEAFRRTISAAAHEVDHPVGGNHRLVVSEKGCRWCPAKHICPAQRAIVDDALGLLPEPVDALSDESLFDVFSRARNIRTYLDAVEDYVREKDDPDLASFGFERKRGATRRSWNLPEEEVATRLEELGVAPYELVLKTPAKIEKELDVLAFADIVEVDFNRPKIVNVKPAVANFKVSKKEV